MKIWRVAEFDFAPLSKFLMGSDSPVPIAEFNSQTKEEDIQLIIDAPKLLESLNRMVAWYGERSRDLDELLPCNEQQPEIQQAMEVIAGVEEE